MQEIVKNEKAEILRYAAKVLKQEIEKLSGLETLPLNPENISLAATQGVVPEHLKRLCGASEHKLLKILSIAQGIILWVMMHSKRCQNKWDGLVVSLKAGLRSREYITLLNKFGESVNYHEVLGTDAYWAKQIVERGNGYATIPTNTVLVNLPKQHLIMQTIVKKMLHNMLPIPLFISSAAMGNLIGTSARTSPDVFWKGTAILDHNSTRAFAYSHCKQKVYSSMIL